MSTRRVGLAVLVMGLAIGVLSAATGTVPLLQRLWLNVDARTIADTGSGATATLTLTPKTSYVAITCSDTDGCDITMGETGALNGTRVVVVNVSANNVNFTDSAAVLELGGGTAAALGQWESVELLYVTDRWVEIGRTT